MMQGDKARKKPEKSALMHAGELLARQEHSVRQLAEKLLRKGHEEAEVEAAIASLEAAHYINDEENCKRQFLRLYEDSRKSIREIRFKLESWGFDRSLIAACVPEDCYAREVAAAAQALRVKYGKEQPREKMLQYLYRHGFSAAVSVAAYAEWKEAREVEN